MACPRSCQTDIADPAARARCAVDCSKVERMVHSLLLPGAAARDLVAAHAEMLAALGSAGAPRL
jgi:hypothetical protein